MGGDRKRHTTEMKHGFRYMLRARATHQKAFQYSTLWDRFHQRFMSSFNARRSQKRQKHTVPQISRAQGQFVKSDKIAKKLTKMLIWASKIKFRKISMRNFKNDSQF